MVSGSSGQTGRGSIETTNASVDDPVCDARRDIDLSTSIEPAGLEVGALAIGANRLDSRSNPRISIRYVNGSSPFLFRHRTRADVPDSIFSRGSELLRIDMPVREWFTVRKFL